LREQRDDGYIKYKEEIKRLKAKLAVAEDAIKSCSHGQEIAGLRSRLEGKNTEIQRLGTKLDKATAAATPKPCGHGLELTALKRDIDSKATKIKNQANTYNQLQALYNRLRTAHGGQPVTTQSTSKSNESGPGFSFAGEGAHTLPGSQQNVSSSQDRKAKKRGTAAAEVKAATLW
jgi:predicted RNase H-like nuclease (RuvC/YqgF family)